ncbi:hypothetical protein GpartN1_g1932.t1 [Galdieria partita]|uniref:Mitochondrial import inner membrane translocase subunit TIM50 n=1 Tax=Galdieria partita TaxID=83374 RepID=A0A9C7PUH2_9RHOD|nr:hypothetical protein GpartN1_g1932.t1 [Galdieria partita]
MATNKVIILDIDGTLGCLVYDHPSKLTSNMEMDRVHYLQPSAYFVARSFCEWFLEFCRYFFVKVVVFSAGGKEYVDNIVSSIFPFIPDAVFSHENLDKNRLKSLDVVREEIPFAFQHNTIILEDNPEAWEPYNQENIVKVPECRFLGASSYERDDYTFANLRKWLMTQVYSSVDVRREIAAVKSLEKEQ